MPAMSITSLVARLRSGYRSKAGTMHNHGTIFKTENAYYVENVITA